MAVRRPAVRRKRAAQYHHGALRDALVACGRQEVARHGWRDLSLRAIARRLSVSHAAAYRHFTDREELLAAVAAASMDDLALVLEAAERGTVTSPQAPEAAILAIARGYLDFAVGRQHEFRLMFSHEIVPASRHAVLRSASDRASAPIVRQVTRFLSNGPVRPAAQHHEDVTATALQIWSLVHGATTLFLERQFEEGALSAAGARERESDGVTRLVDQGVRRLLSVLALERTRTRSAP